MDTDPPPADPHAAPLPILLLRVSGLTLAIRQGAVAELLPLPRLDPVPEAPPILRGAFHLGGTLVFVLPIAALLGLAGEAEGRPLYHHLLLLPPRSGEVRLALLADRVMAAAEAEAQLMPPGASFNDCVEGDLRHQGAVVPLLAVEKLLASRERLQLTAFAERREARARAFGLDEG